MLQGEQELYDLMKEQGLDVINVSDFGLELENEPVTHAIIMEQYLSGKPCVNLTSGEPSDEDTLYWDGKRYEDLGISGSAFENVCEKIVELF